MGVRVLSPVFFLYRADSVGGLLAFNLVSRRVWIFLFLFLFFSVVRTDASQSLNTSLCGRQVQGDIV